MQNAYLRLERQTKHPLLKGLEEAPRIIHGVARIEIEPREKFGPAPLTLIPSYPDLPMEKVYPREPKTNIAQVFAWTPHGSNHGGRVVYFPWDIDRTFWEVLSVDHLKLLRNAVEWAANERPIVEVVGPGVLDVTIWRQRDSMTVHLVNLTNPMMMKGPIREIIPLGQQVVRLTLPHRAKPKKVHLFAAGRTVRFQQDQSRLAIAVPSIADHEIVAIDL